MTAREQLLSFLSKADDPNSGGRQMPMHYGHKDLRIISQSSPTGSQFLQALGSALAAQYDDSNDIVYVSSGEGTTSQGDFHEALNWASNSKAPIIFHIQDNEYAISTHRSEQSADSVYTRAAGYKNLTRYDVDGTDFFETHLAFKKACERGRKGQGPSVIISNVVRLLPHSSSDDQRKYRTKDDLSQDLERDPLLILKNQCLEKKFISEKEFENITSQVKEQINTDVIWADEQSYPDESTALDHIYSMDPPIAESTFKPIRDSVVIVDAINHALKEEMAINDKMIIYGQDIADPKGGVFTATKGLSDEFGMKRVFNSPLAESSIVGTAIGLAVTGYKPVIEIQFGDYIWTAMNQIRNEVVTMRYRSNNSWNCPIVIRTPVGGYIHGGLCHSQSIDGYFIHMPGIYLAYPSNAADAKGLLKMACRMNDPVLFMEHKGLYRQGYASTQEPDEDYVIPFGKGRLVSAGDTISIITWGAMVQKSVEAVKSLELDDGLIEIIDLRTLNPLDIDMIKKSVEKTGKALIIYEDNLTNGPGAEISAIISEQCFEFLDGPIKRIASKDSPVPFNWFLEEKVLPQAEDIALGIKELMEY
tara:strand:- start:243 stop:2009 length:1767 start_codon:yes stop_codon:yes gene_type:complete